MLMTEQENRSQLGFADPLPHSRPNPAPANSREALSPDIPRAVSGHKRSSLEVLGPSDCQNASKVLCRNLFSPDTEQFASSSAAPQSLAMHPSQNSPSPMAEANTQPSSGQAPPAQSGQPPSALTPVRRTPTPDPWSSLLGGSSQVLHNRLTISNLLPSITATGQQLLEVEAQLQALLGMRRDEEGSNNICWVDHSFVNGTHGVLQFHRIYGDAECAQVTIPTWGSIQ